jgi:hypothetical protein
MFCGWTAVSEDITQAPAQACGLEKQVGHVSLEYASLCVRPCCRVLYHMDSATPSIDTIALDAVLDEFSLTRALQAGLRQLAAILRHYRVCVRTHARRYPRVVVPCELLPVHDTPTGHRIRETRHAIAAYVERKASPSTSSYSCNG